MSNFQFWILISNMYIAASFAVPMPAWFGCMFMAALTFAVGWTFGRKEKRLNLDSIAEDLRRMDKEVKD